MNSTDSQRVSWGRPVAEIIKQRYACRIYAPMPLAAEPAGQLRAFMAAIRGGPLGAGCRFELAAATEQDQTALRGLGTYGLIKHPAGFIIGAAGPGERNLEDFGYAMETIILEATRLGLATCWLGGNFTKHSFSGKIRANRDEIVPAVAAVGYAAETSRTHDRLRQQAKSDTRQPWEKLFFESGFGTPLSEADAGAYAQPLEMVRRAPSGHNYQPWRIVRQGACFHFYLRRTHGYGPGSLAFVLLDVVDLPRVEMGIAMCHFELTARELGLAGRWAVQAPAIPPPDEAVEYVVTWHGQVDQEMG